MVVESVVRKPRLELFMICRLFRVIEYDVWESFTSTENEIVPFGDVISAESIVQAERDRMPKNNRGSIRDFIL